MKASSIKIVIYIVTAFFLLVVQSATAATVGVIDPRNVGNHFAAFVHAPTVTPGSERINFGLFASASAANITISGGSLHGYAWSPIAGWIVLNCANTTSGCTTGNQNFKVSVSNTGVLSGYAWGQQTGWINFGPFNNNNTAQVLIAPNGLFTGTTGSAGYAWNQKYGWIVFDCSNTATCTETDYGVTPPTPPPVTPPSSGGGVSGGGFPPAMPQQPVTPQQPDTVTVPETIPPPTATPAESLPTNIPPSTVPAVPNNGSAPISLPTEPTELPSGISIQTPGQNTVTTVATSVKKTVFRKVYNVIAVVKEKLKSPATLPTIIGLVFILLLILLRFIK